MIGEVPIEGRPSLDVITALVRRARNETDSLYTKFVSILLATSVEVEGRGAAFLHAMGNKEWTAAEVLANLDTLEAGPEAHVAAAFAGYYRRAEIDGDLTLTPGQRVEIVEAHVQV